MELTDNLKNQLDIKESLPTIEEIEAELSEDEDNIEKH